MYYNFLQGGSILSILCIATVITMQTFLYGWHKVRIWQMWVASVLLPVIGYSTGIITSLILCQRGLVPRTVAFETGCQNVALALSVIALSFPTHIVKKVIIIPTLFGVFQLLVGFVPIGIYRIYRCFKPVKPTEPMTYKIGYDNEAMEGAKDSNVECITHL